LSLGNEVGAVTTLPSASDILHPENLRFSLCARLPFSPPLLGLAAG
jgi:hypothetical protein